MRPLQNRSAASSPPPLGCYVPPSHCGQEARPPGRLNRPQPIDANSIGNPPPPSHCGQEARPPGRLNRLLSVDTNFIGNPPLPPERPLWESASSYAAAALSSTGSASRRLSRKHTTGLPSTGIMEETDNTGHGLRRQGSMAQRSGHDWLVSMVSYGGSLLRPNFLRASSCFSACSCSLLILVRATGSPQMRSRGGRGANHKSKGRFCRERDRKVIVGVSLCQG
jgi:hypothetical protein